MQLEHILQIFAVYNLVYMSNAVSFSKSGKVGTLLKVAFGTLNVKIKKSFWLRNSF